MRGRIQRLLGEECCKWWQKLCRLSTVLCKASSLRQEIARWLKRGEWAIAYWLLDYVLPWPYHCAASFVRMSSQCKRPAHALVWPSPQSSHVTGPRFVTTWGTMHGRIQRLLGEECCEWCQKLCRLSTVLCKASSLRWEIATNLDRTQVKDWGEEFDSTPPPRQTWADACITRAPTAPSQNKLTSPV
jgi:hypothetical protein